MGARDSSRKGPLHDPAYRQLCGLLRQWREDAGLPQRELAAKLKKIHTYVAKSEQGERRIDPIEMIRWARACNLKPSKALKQIEPLVK
ncbi:MAG: helix-turn-helix transcriptional regulator [Planctomycetota bacterium]